MVDVVSGTDAGATSSFICNFTQFQNTAIWQQNKCYFTWIELWESSPRASSCTIFVSMMYSSTLGLTAVLVLTAGGGGGGGSRAFRGSLLACGGKWLLSGCPVGFKWY